MYPKPVINSPLRMLLDRIRRPLMRQDAPPADNPGVVPLSPIGNADAGQSAPMDFPARDLSNLPTQAQIQGYSDGPGLLDDLAPLRDRPQWSGYDPGPAPVYTPPTRNTRGEARQGILASLVSALAGGLLGGGQGAATGLVSGGRSAEDEQDRIAADQAVRAREEFKAKQDSFQAKDTNAVRRYNDDLDSYNSDVNSHIRLKGEEDQRLQRIDMRTLAQEAAKLTAKNATEAAKRVEESADTEATNKLITSLKGAATPEERQNILTLAGTDPRMAKIIARLPKDGSGQPMVGQLDGAETPAQKFDKLQALRKSQLDHLMATGDDSPATLKRVNQLTQALTPGAPPLTTIKKAITPVQQAAMDNDKKRLGLQEREFDYRKQHDEIVRGLQTSLQATQNAAKLAKTDDDRMKIVRELDQKISAERVSIASSVAKGHTTTDEDLTGKHPQKVTKYTTPTQEEVDQAAAVKQAHLQGKAALKNELDSLLGTMGKRRVAPGRYEPIGSAPTKKATPPPAPSARIDASAIMGNPVSDPGLTSFATPVVPSEGKRVPVHHSQLQPRNDDGQFNGPPKKVAKKLTPKPSPTPVSVYHEKF